MPNSGNGHVPNLDLLDPADVGMKSGPTTEEMAAWMGMESGGTSASVGAYEGTADLGLEVVTDEELDSGRVDETGKTKTPLWSNPLVKLVFVAGVAGACLVMVGLVVNTIQSAGSRDLASSSTPNQRLEEEPFENPMISALRDREQEIGELKTRNALGNQQLALEMQESGANQVSAAELLALRNQLEQRRQLQQSAENPAPSTVSRPQEVSISRPAPASTPSPVPPSRATRAPATRPVTRSASAERDISPQERLAALGGYGSYGSGSALPPNSIAATTPSPPTSVSGAAQDESSSQAPAFADPGVTSATIPAFQASPKQANMTLAEEEAAILGHTLVTVQAGTYAQAKLETPLYWAQDLANEQQSQRTALKLSEPLYGSWGEVALEAGTLLVAEIEVIAGSGLLQLYVTDVVVTKNGQQQVLSIPNQNLVITGAEGQPLVAHEIQNINEIRAAEVQLAALGALGNVGELLNRPDAQQNTVGIGGSVVSVENGPVNILAGLLEGAADAVLPIERNRVENRIDDYENQPRIWFHDANAPVMLFVAEEFTFQAD